MLWQSWLTRINSSYKISALRIYWRHCCINFRLTFNLYNKKPFDVQTTAGFIAPTIDHYIAKTGVRNLFEIDLFDLTPCTSLFDLRHNLPDLTAFVDMHGLRDSTHAPSPSGCVTSLRISKRVTYLGSSIKTKSMDDSSVRLRKYANCAWE